MDFNDAKTNGILTISKLQASLEKVKNEFGDVVVQCDYDSIVRIEICGSDEKKVILITSECLNQLKQGH